MVGIASEISAGTEPGPPVQDVYNLINDRCWLPRCPMLQLAVLAGDHAHRPGVDWSSSTCRYAVMHTPSTNTRNVCSNEFNRSHWVALQLHTVCEVGSSPAATMD